LFFKKLFVTENSSKTKTLPNLNKQVSTKPATRKKLPHIRMILVFIWVLFLIGGLFTIYFQNQRTAKVNAIIETSNKLIEEGLYEDANKKLKEAIAIKRTKYLAEYLALSNELLESDGKFQEGIKYYQEHNYKLAIDSFKEVSDKDLKNYTAAITYIEQASNNLAIEILNKAKKLYSSGSYKQAYQTLLQAQEISPLLEEIKQLQPIYEEAKQRQEEQERLEAEKQAREEVRNRMKKYEFGTGVVGIAVGEVKTSSRVNGDYGFYSYIKDPQHFQFLWLWIRAINIGTISVHVNPNDFRVTSPDGYTANYDAASFNVKYLDATNIPPNSYITGWLIFVVPKTDNYVLHYNGLSGSVTKRIIL